jgi:hypothetical protein
MNEFAVLTNFRYINHKNQIFYAQGQKCVYVLVFNFKKMYEQILKVVKHQHSNVIALDFDYFILSSPYISYY